MSSGNNSTVSSQRNAFARFFKSEATSSILLLLCTIVALLWANSSRSELYFQILQTKVGVSWGDSKFALSLHHWINDGLMTLFFFIVGLEIKREIVVGQLSTFKKAILPVAAAVGGMVVPALIYLSLNAGGEGARGWGIPWRRTLLLRLGSCPCWVRAFPVGLKLFLTALAIADDLGAVLVIAVFYTEQIRVGALLVAVVLIVLLVVAQRLRIRQRCYLRSPRHWRLARRRHVRCACHCGRDSRCHGRARSLTDRPEEIPQHCPRPYRDPRKQFRF